MKNTGHNSRLQMSIALAVIIIIFNTFLTQAYGGSSLPVIKKPTDNLEIIRVEAKNPTAGGFTIEFTVNDEAVNKNADLIYAYTIYESLIIKNYNIGHSKIIPTTKTKPINELKRIWTEKDKNIYSVDIEEVMPQTFYIYAMLKTQDGESEVLSCELAAEKETVYSVLIPYYWYTPTPMPAPGVTPTPTPIPGVTQMPTPVPVVTPTPTPAAIPWKFVDGAHHFLFIDSNNELWGYGMNQYGQLGTGSTSNSVTTPVNIMSNVVDVSAGNCSSFAITKSGELYGWGLNQNYELGLGYGENENILTPTKIMDNVKMVSSALDYSLALTVTGEVYGWGVNYNNAAIVAGAGIYYEPEYVMDGVKFIECNRHASFAIKTNGDLWAWGENRSYQLGNGTSMFLPAPTFIMSDVKSVSTGLIFDYCTGIITNSGELYWAGRNFMFDSANTLAQPFMFTTPTKIDGMENIKDLALGWGHALALKENGEVWVWGQDENGQLGLGYTTGKLYPEHLITADIGNNVIAISAGDTNSHIQLSNYDMYGFGTNFAGQLGDGTTTNSGIPVKVILPNAAP